MLKWALKPKTYQLFLLFNLNKSYITKIINHIFKIEFSKKALETRGRNFKINTYWVPRSFCVPGRRIKLHPDDYYSLGGKPGGIDERLVFSNHCRNKNAASDFQKFDRVEPYHAFEDAELKPNSFTKRRNWWTRCSASLVIDFWNGHKFLAIVS